MNALVYTNSKTKNNDRYYKNKLIARINRFYKRHGLLKSLLSVCEVIFLKAISPIVTYYATYIVEKDLKIQNFSLEPEIQIKIEQLQPKDFDAVIKLHNGNAPKAIKNRLIKKEWCFVAKHNDEICCDVWTTFGKTEICDEHKKLLINYKEVYLHEVMTSSCYRGKNIAPFLINYVCKLFGDKGYSRIFAIIYSNNFPSLEAFKKIGFRKIELVRYFKIPLLKKVFYTTKLLRG